MNVDVWHAVAVSDEPLAARREHRRAVREVLAAALDCKPDDVEVRTLPGGKPVLADPALGYHFNVSHSGPHLVVAATDGGPVGIDAERRRSLQDADAVADRVLAPTERRALSLLPDTDRGPAVLRAWTRKEALLKADGVGLARAPGSLEVGWDQAPAERAIARPVAHSAGWPWHLYDVLVEDDLVVALATSGPARVTCHEWRPLGKTHPRQGDRAGEPATGDVIAVMAYSDRWWWWPAGSPQAQRPVLFFPPAGADQTVVNPLVHHLAGIRFGALRMPGRGLRRHEPVPDRLDEAVAAIATSVLAMAGPPPLLVGHSFGGLVAFAVAQELDRRGRPAARLMAVASTAPHAWEDHLASNGAWRSGGVGSRAEGSEAVGSGADEGDGYVERRVRRLLADGAVPAELADHPELGPVVRDALAADVRMSYLLIDTSPLSCPITSVVARDDALVHRDASALWNKASSRQVEEIVVPGDHFFYRSNPQVLSRLIVGEATALDGAYHVD